MYAQETMSKEHKGNASFISRLGPNPNVVSLVTQIISHGTSLFLSSQEPGGSRGKVSLDIYSFATQRMLFIMNFSGKSLFPQGSQEVATRRWVNDNGGAKNNQPVVPTRKRIYVSGPNLMPTALCYPVTPEKILYTLKKLEHSMKMLEQFSHVICHFVGLSIILGFQKSLQEGDN